MDLSAIFQLRTKKFWWMDVIFYFVMSLLVATILCYIIFLTKNSFLRKDIEKEIEALETVGTGMQKKQEEEVLKYQKKVQDFSELFQNHEFASQVFYFMQQETRPNVWFERFGLRGKEAVVDLAGESDDNEAFSRQIAVFERSEYVKNINLLNSTLGESSKIEFNLALSLDPKIFSYLPDLNPTEFVSESEQPIIEDENQNNTQEISGEKLIIIFKFPQVSENSGRVDLENNTVVVDLPFGTDITNLIPSIVISPKAAISPESGLNQDFTNPVIYRVTAEDGTAQDYNVSVNVLPEVIGKQGQSAFSVIFTVILLILVVAAIAGGAFFIYKKRLNNKPQI